MPPYSIPFENRTEPRFDSWYLDTVVGDLFSNYISHLFDTERDCEVFLADAGVQELIAKARPLSQRAFALARALPQRAGANGAVFTDTQCDVSPGAVRSS